MIKVKSRTITSSIRLPAIARAGRRERPDLGSSALNLLAGDPDPPVVFRISPWFAEFAIPSLQRNFHIALALKALELLSPLYQENAVVSDEVIEPQRFQLARRINPVQVDVVEVSLGTAIFVDQSEGGAGDIVRGCGLE